MEPIKQHPFEKTLGAGPYKFVGSVTIIKPSERNPEGNYKQLGQEKPTKFVRGMGTCAHCSHAIMNVYFVEVGNGDVYGVGCDCIMKVGMEPQEIKKVEKAEQARLKEQRKVRKQNNIDTAFTELEQFLNTKRDVLAALPHPRGFSESSLLDYATWVFENVNNPVYSVKLIKKLIGSLK